MQRKNRFSGCQKAIAALAALAPGLFAVAGAQAQDAGAAGKPVAPVESRQPLSAATVAQGLSNPWAVAFLPGGRFLVTERPGRMRVIEANGRLGAPLPGLPP
ncbi:PQQ-dependent sugar dehydrogenase, partial [Paracidovorax anthurii]